MILEAIPETPLKLTSEQAERMQQSQIKKHHVAIVLLHWFNALVWLFELLTGAAIITAPAYRFAPSWFLSMVAGIFGPRENLLRAHIAVGMTWTIVFLVYAVFGWKNYLHAEVLRKEIGLDRDDVRWLKIRTLRLLGRSEDLLPTQGAYNAGQKLYALLVYSAIPLIILTGLEMVFHLGGSTLVSWAMLIHFVMVGMIVSGLMVHVYMGAVFPEERPAFYSMITGMVDEFYAYKHHFKWWREVRLEQQRFLTAEAENSADQSSEDKTDGCDACHSV